MSHNIYSAATFTHASDIMSIFTPLRNSGIDGFFYTRNFHSDGSFIDISNEVHRTEHFLKGYLNEAYDRFSIRDHILPGGEVAIWSLNTKNEVWQLYFRDFDVKEGVTVSHNYDDYQDVFGFHIRRSSGLSTADLIAKIDILKLFMKYFLEVAAPLIATSGRAPFKIPKKYLYSKKVNALQTDKHEKALFQLAGIPSHINVAEFDRLSNREIECINLAGSGMTSEEIGSHLLLSKRTVELYISSARSKTGCRNITELVFRYCQLKNLDII